MEKERLAKLSCSMWLRVSTPSGPVTVTCGAVLGEVIARDWGAEDCRIEPVAPVQCVVATSPIQGVVAAQALQCLRTNISGNREAYFAGWVSQRVESL